MGSGGIAPLIPSLSTIWKLISSTHRALCPRERAHSTRQIGSWVGPIACWMLPLQRTGGQFRNIIWMCAKGISFDINTNLCYLYRVIRKSLRDFRPLRYSSRDGHAEGEHVNRGRDTPSFCPNLTGARYVHPWWRGRCQSCNQVPGRNLCYLYRVIH